MRRSIVTILALVALLAGSGTAEAQVQWGLKGGLNFSNVDSDDAIFGENETRKGVAVGTFMTFGSAAFISWQPEVIFSQLGTEFVNSGVESELKTNYIQIPVLARFNFGAAPGEGMRPHLLLGPYLAINIDCDIDIGDGPGTDCSEEDETAAGYPTIKGTDWGGVFGGGLEFSGARGSLYIDGRYNLGLADLFDDESLSTGDDNAKQNAWTVLIGFGMRLGGN